MVMERQNTQVWQQITEIELRYKSKVKASQRPQVNCSQDVYEAFMNIWDQNKIELVEEFKVFFLNRSNRILCLYQLSYGGMTGTIADPRLIFVAALKVGACSMLLCHNHPSGNLKASKADEELTYKIREAGKFLDIKVLDHLIISPEGYFSFADEGILCM
jgi:DNA repair protein RadC